MLLIAFAPLVSSGMDRLNALSMIETGNDDRVVGRAGEISRYQVLKAEWNSVTTSRNYQDARLAREVALKLLEQRLGRFQELHKRPPTDFEFYALWNAPTQALTGRISRVVAERSQRFANLCGWNSRAAASPRTASPMVAQAVF